ncbi:hypothetical protein Fuma_01070 [Fuerstiella marisgermanici]|uniref:Uncharacterized protein n=1 Tax=Fuerstiella marisgermanici TaxID=1891926 RepID=A0A1P8WBP1_9PLAN|nr:hypothetical protein Fuma_01070 [Fuerstiella marisgermanici]
MRMYREHVGESLRDSIQRLRETLLRGTKVLAARLTSTLLLQRPRQQVLRDLLHSSIGAVRAAEV